MMLRAEPVIGTIKVRTRQPDSAALRLAVERQLQAGSFQARGIGPSAILLIRRMADPLPQRLRTDVRGAGAQPEWQRALQSRMDSLCQSATRPDAGRVADSAEAVLFADEAELLACLALELSRGGPASWWRLAVARYFDCSSVFRLIRAQPQLLPPVFANLASGSRLHEVLQALSELEVLELCALFTAAHELPALGREVMRYQALGPSSSADAGVDETSPIDESFLPAGPEARAAQAPARGTPRFSTRRIDSWIPDGIPRHDLPRRLLGALVLGFRHRPQEMHAAHFAPELRAWLHREANPARDAFEVPVDRPATRDAARPSAQLPDPAATAPTIHPLVGDSAPTFETSATEPARVDMEPDALAIEPSTIAAQARLDGVVTELGGIFLLINVMEHLGLPECFEDSCGLASATGAAGTLEAIARVLAGTLGDELRHDPVWSVLATLDGREPHEPPRAEGLRTAADSLPASWRELLGNEDPPALDASHIAALDALRRENWPPALLDWLRLTLPHISARIALACGLPEVTEASKMLLELPARVYITEAHVDVVASIENIRLPIRLAGLDRSPGWVRSLQRVVLVHFE